MNASQIHNWLKDPQFAQEPELAEPDSHGGFLPIEIEGAVAVPLVEEAGDLDEFFSMQRVEMNRVFSETNLPLTANGLCVGEDYVIFC